MNYEIIKPKWSRITAEQITYIKENAGRPYRVVAKELGVSHITVFNHVNGLIKKSFIKKRSERLAVDRLMNLTNFETNGNFDINKWANCSHV